jgi:hypothetical protein
MRRITSLKHGLSATLISLALVLAALAEPLSAWAGDGSPHGF